MLMLMASCHFLRFMEQTQKKTVRLLRKGKPSVCQLRQSDHTTRAQKGVERKQLCFNCTGANQSPRVSLFCVLQVLQPKTPLVHLSQEDTSTIAGAYVGSYWERIRHLSGGHRECGWNPLLRAVRHWCWELLRICCLARLHGETASSKRVQTHQNDDASEQQRDRDVVISTWRGNFSFEPK